VDQLPAKEELLAEEEPVAEEEPMVEVAAQPGQVFAEAVAKGEAKGKGRAWD
jgi:hypothetical protein